MNSSGILVIADLHFCCEDSDFEQSLIQTDSDYELLFEKFLRDVTHDGLKIQSIIVAGDLTQTGRKKECEDAFAFINKLCNKLNIDNDNVLIVPGNHDFIRFACEKAIEDNTIKYDDRSKLNDIKFETFARCFSEFYKGEKKFNPNSAVVDVLPVKSMGVVFIGVNSIYKDSHRNIDHVGFIDETTLDDKLAEIQNKYGDYRKIIVVHHNCVGTDVFRRGIQNWSKVKIILEKYGIRDYISGHVHTSMGECRSRRNNQVRYLTCGSMGDPSQEIDNDVFLLVHEENKNILQVQNYKYLGRSYNTEKKHWEKIDGDESILDHFVIQEDTGVKGIAKATQNLDNNDVLASRSNTSINRQSSGEEDKQIDPILNEGVNFFDKVIYEKKLYVDGHFHWNEKGRSLSYLITDVFFDDYSCFEKMKICCKAALEKKKVRPDLILGYEMNGSILGMNLAIEYGCDFSYITASERNYTVYEKQLHKRKKYSIVLVVVDFLYKNNLTFEIRKVIKDFFGEVKIFFCAVFDDCTDYKNQKEDVIAVKHIPILSCEYRDNECPLEKSGLVEVCRLYTENVDSKEREE